MNEYIEVKFRKNGSWLKIKREVPGGIELDEPDPIPRTVYVGISAYDNVTRYRMRHIRQIKGWAPGTFRLRVAPEGGVLVIRGVDKDSLPEGRYTLSVRLEEADATQARRVDVEHDGFAEHAVDLALDDRDILCDGDPVDLEIARVLGDSSFGSQSAVEWINDPQWRPTKKACLLNLLASLRVRPGVTDPLIADVERFFSIANDRAYARVAPELHATLVRLGQDHDKFYPEGPPTDAIHRRLLDHVPNDEKPFFPLDCLLSFRGEGRPSLQAVIATPPAGFGHTYAEFDLDLGNPLQDLEGFVVHMLELTDDKPTNHLDLYDELRKTKAADYLYYTVIG